MAVARLQVHGLILAARLGRPFFQLHRNRRQKSQLLQRSRSAVFSRMLASDMSEACPRIHGSPSFGQQRLVFKLILCTWHCLRLCCAMLVPPVGLVIGMSLLEVGKRSRKRFFHCLREHICVHVRMSSSDNATMPHQTHWLPSLATTCIHSEKHLSNA